MYEREPNKLQNIELFMNKWFKTTGDFFYSFWFILWLTRPLSEIGILSRIEQYEVVFVNFGFIEDGLWNIYYELYMYKSLHT